MFGGPSFGWLGAVINFQDTTGHFDAIIRQLYVRQALAHLIDQQTVVKTMFKSAAAVNYGPVPQLPVNPYTPANNRSVNGPYPYDPSAAAALLKAHGWKVVPGGQTTCQKAGSGAGECGAGIPAGTPLTFNWVDLPRSESPTSALEGQAFASEAKTALGVTVKLETRTFEYQLANFDDANPNASANRNDWAIANDGAFFYNYYPASAQTFSTGGVFNTGGFSDARADTLMRASVFGPDPNAVTREAHELTAALPGAVRARACRRLRGLQQGRRRSAGVRRAHPAVVPAPILVPERLGDAAVGLQRSAARTRAHRGRNAGVRRRNVASPVGKRLIENDIGARRVVGFVNMRRVSPRRSWGRRDGDGRVQRPAIAL